MVRVYIIYPLHSNKPIESVLHKGGEAYKVSVQTNGKDEAISEILTNRNRLYSDPKIQ